MIQFIERDEVQAHAPQNGREFAFFAANIQHLLGIQCVDVQQKLYQAVCDFSTAQAESDMKSFAYNDHTFFLSALDEPGFILTFHFGHYRAIPVFLLDRGYKVCIPVAKNVIGQQEEYYHEVMGKHWGEKLLFLDAENPQLFFRLRQLRNQGFHILCYVDGGVGATAGVDPQKLLKIPFLNGEITVRSRIVEMAHLLRSKISVLIADALVEDGKLCIRSLDFCDTAWYGDRKYFNDYYLRSIYRDFEQVLLQDPQAWEAWLYLHRIMSPGSQEGRWNKENRFVTFLNGSEQLLLDKFTYLSYRLQQG